MAARQVDLTDARDAGRAAWSGWPPRTRRCPTTRGWRATAGTATDGAAGRPPTTSSASRRVARRASGPTTTTRCGPATRPSPWPVSGRTIRTAASCGGRRTVDPRASLFETATRLVTIHVPPPTPDELADAIEATGRELLALGVVACHDPGGRRARSRPVLLLPGLRPARRGRPAADPGPRLACATTRSPRPSSRATAAGRSWATTQTAWPASAGRSASPTGRSGRARPPCSRTSNPSRTGRSPADQRRGVWMTDPDGLRERVAMADGGWHHQPDPRHRRRRDPGRS